MLLLWLYLSVLLAPYLSVAQEYSSHYTKGGLAGATVNQMAQSKYGFIWLASETGLSRFDGQQFN